MSGSRSRRTPCECEMKLYSIKIKIASTLRDVTSGTYTQSSGELYKKAQKGQAKWNEKKLRL